MDDFVFVFRFKRRGLIWSAPNVLLAWCLRLPLPHPPPRVSPDRLASAQPVNIKQTNMNMNPVAGWIKNIIDHAIHGKPRCPSPSSSSPSSSSAAASSPPPGSANANTSANENDVFTPLLASLASALRGDLEYPRPGAGAGAGAAEPSVDGNAYNSLTAAAALAPPPCRDPTLRPNRRVALRREMLGDRKLRVARFLMETATAGRTLQRHGDGAAGVAGTEQGHVQQHQQTAVSVYKARRLLALSTGVFGRRLPGGRRSGRAGTGGGGGSRSSLTSQHPRPPLSVERDILPLIRPTYSLLGQALLGDAGLARQLAPEAVAVASALAVAGLDYALSAPTPTAPTTAAARRGLGLEGQRESGSVEGGGGGGQEGNVATKRRAAQCFAEVVVLAVSTHLGMVLASVRPTPADGGIGGGNSGDGGGLADLGPLESHLEQLLESLGAWDSPGGEGRGWPHSSLPVAVENSSSGRGGGAEAAAGGVPRAEQSAHTVEDGIPLPELLKEVEKMVTDFRSTEGAGGETGEVMRQMLDNALAPRLEACRGLLSAAAGQRWT